MTDRTPWPMVQNGPIPERDWDDDDRIMVFGPDKGVGLVPTGGTQIAADRLADGSVARSVEDELLDQRVSAKRWGLSESASGAVNLAALQAGDAWCCANKRTLFIPAGTYAVTGTFSGTAEPYTVQRASWVGEGKDKTKLSITLSSSSHRWMRTYSLAANTYANNRSTASPYSTVWAIDDVVAGQGFVTFSTPSELTTAVGAGTLAVGGLIHIAAGMNVQDADDATLWFYDQIHRIKAFDTSNGKIYLDDGIDLRLTSQGWDGSASGKNAATTYANSTAYTAGQYVWDETATSTLYVATTSGTSNSANRSSDTGVTWKQVTTSLGAVKDGAVDRRPIVQAAYAPVSDITISDMTMEFNQGLFWADIRAAYNISLERLRISGTKEYVSIASRYVRHRDVEIINSAAATNTASPCLETYNSRKVYLDGCLLKGGGTGTNSSNYIVKLESHAELIASNSVFALLDRSTSTAIGVMNDRGEFKARGCQFLNTQDPFRHGTTGKLYEEVVWQHWDVKECLIHAASKNLRQSTDAFEHPAFASPTNEFLFTPVNSSGFSQTDQWRFRPSHRAVIQASFTAASNQSGTTITIPMNVYQAAGIEDPATTSFVVLGATAYWSSAGSNTMDVRFAGKKTSGGTTRNLFHSTGSSNNIQMTSSVPNGSIWKGDGSGYRMIEGGLETLFLSYFSGASAGTGTVYVNVHVLVGNTEKV